MFEVKENPINSDEILITLKGDLLSIQCRVIVMDFDGDKEKAMEFANLLCKCMNDNHPIFKYG